jgi:hypothetical protein
LLHWAKLWYVGAAELVRPIFNSGSTHGDAAGKNIVEHVAGVDDFEVGTAAYRAALTAGRMRACDFADEESHNRKSLRVSPIAVASFP